MGEALCRSLYGIQDDGHLTRARLAIDSGQLKGAVEETFRAIDISGSGKLTWNSGEIRRFTTELFMKFDLAAPSEHYLYAMATAFDVDGDRCLGLTSCNRL